MKKVEQVTDLMPGNLAPEIMIKCRDAEFYNLQVQTRIIDPRRPSDPIIRVRILVLDEDNYTRYFRCSVADQIGYMRTMNIRDVVLVHDPGLNSESLRKEIEDRKPQPSSELLARQKKVAATIGDLSELIK